MSVSLDKNKSSGTPLNRGEGKTCEWCRSNARTDTSLIILFGGILLPFFITALTDLGDATDILLFIVFLVLSVMTFFRVLPMRLEAADREAKKIGSHYHL